MLQIFYISHMKNREESLCFLLACIFLLLLFLPAKAEAQLLTGYEEKGQKEIASRSADYDKSQPVDLVADTLEHDDKAQIITASGNVRLTQGQRTLYADKILYNIKTDTVKAVGNIVLVEPTGDTHYADEVELQQEMKQGFVIGLTSSLAEGGKFQAQSGRRYGEVITMYGASYTPCDCEEDTDRPPGWQINADEVVYDKAENKISYKNAQFEILGVPVAWSPYLAHPDGSVDQKSGLLAPQAGYASQLGFMLTNNYYWAIAPDRDATFGVMLTTQEVPVGLGEYRQRFENAAIVIRGSATYSGRTDSVAGEDVSLEEEWRGHLFADGLWDINEKWRAGLDLELTTDDQYLRQYDFSNDDVLENEIYVQRFSGRNYAVGRLLAFQDIRVREEQTDQPNILPEIEVSMLGQPSQTLGGRWALDLSFLQLEREGNDPDMTRAVGQAGWERRYVSDYGLVNVMGASARMDAYYVRDHNAQVQSDDETELRIFPRIHNVTSYPLVKDYENSQAMISPIIALTLAPDINGDNDDIPNEDSQDVQLDSSNIFEPNRFPGKDRIEDGSHITYGVQTGLYGYDGSYANVFLGQSYRFSDDDNPFPEGSGLSDQYSDVVGQVAGMYRDLYGINYRFQIDSSGFSSVRHELDAFAHWKRLHFNTRYLFAKALEGTDIDESREQIENALAYDMTDEWRMRAGTVHDLGVDSGLRKAVMGMDYTGCCLSFSATAERNLTTDASGDSGTDIMLRLGLKNLGEFNTSGIGKSSGETGW